MIALRGNRLTSAVAQSRRKLCALLAPFRWQMVQQVVGSYIWAAPVKDGLHQVGARRVSRSRRVM